MPEQYGGESVAESSKPKKAAKVLRKMEIEPRLGGGISVTHHYTSYQHEPKSHEFTEDEGHEALAHIAKHAGLPHEKVEEQEESEPEPFE
jgi:hypothetical protein